MKKIALALVLAGLSGAAMAEWVAIGESDTFMHYVDPATIRRSGDISKIQTLLGYKTPQLNSDVASFLSTITQTEFDCKEERFRIVYLSRHSESMGAGSVVSTVNAPANSWSPVTPGSIGENQRIFACAKK